MVWRKEYGVAEIDSECQCSDEEENEKEIVMKTKIAATEGKAKEKLVAKRVNNELELENWSKYGTGISRKSIKTPSRGANSKFHQKASSPHRPVSPFIVKKKNKVITNWTKIFRGKKHH